jgi:hypothetical protein
MGLRPAGEDMVQPLFKLTATISPGASTANCGVQQSG